MKGLWILAVILLVVVVAAKIILKSGISPSRAGNDEKRDRLPADAAQCYQEYVRLEKTKKYQQVLTDAFTRQAGILNRIQMLIGYVGDGKSEGDKQGAKQHGRAYFYGQLEAIQEDIARLDQGYTSPMTKEQYYHSLQMEQKGQEELASLTASLSEQRKRLEQDEDFCFFRSLKATLSQAGLLELMGPDERGGEQSEVNSELLQVCRRLTASLEKAGLVFYQYEEVKEQEQKDWFLELPDAQDYPCAVREKDRTLIAFGRVKRLEAARKRNAG